MSLELLFPKDEWFETSIRRWVRIAIIDKIPLQGGVSGAEVYRVQATLDFPGLHDIDELDLEMVVKLSSRKVRNRERHIFKEVVPDHIRSNFINFEEHKPIGEKFCMIMPYLGEFDTFEKCIYTRKEDVADLTAFVFDKITEVQFPSGPFSRQKGGKKYNIGRLISLYLADIQRNIETRIVTHKALKCLVDQTLKVRIEKPNETLEAQLPPLIDAFKETLKNQKKIESLQPYNTPFMHGDCHARNIMINPSSSTLKFIDIDELKPTGDYLYDFGELLADLEVFGYLLGNRNFKVSKEAPRTYSFAVNMHPRIQEALDILEKKIEELAKNAVREEYDWKSRLYLAKARYLFSMVGKTGNDEKTLATYFEAVRMLKNAAMGY